MEKQRPILLVEDDEIDAKTVKRALKELKVANPLVWVTNGEEALFWLRDPAHQRPALLLLDLQMPVMDGLEFLTVAKADPMLRMIPVVVLTTSKLEVDKVASFEQSVAGYMVKPVDYAQFVEVIRTIHLYWTLCEEPL